MGERLGKRTFKYVNVILTGESTVVGRKEGEGPLGDDFDIVKPDNLLGQSSFERAEGVMMQEACRLAIKKANLSLGDIDVMLGGDLLNQTVTSNFCARDLSIPFFGLYGACSTFGEGLILGAALVDSGFVNRALVTVSSHHDSAERQYRYPVEFGGQRPPVAQWTVTGAGATVLQRGSSGVCVTLGTIGTVVDMGVKDANNLGAAMAPAAAGVIKTHFEDTGLKPTDYDLIVTGDLGHVGHEIMKDLLTDEGLSLGTKVNDCGMMVYDKSQDTHAGGSGCGCSASVFLGHILKQMRRGEIRRLLLVPTGALHSPCTIQQGESIPSVAHAVAIEVRDK